MCLLEGPTHCDHVSSYHSSDSHFVSPLYWLNDMSVDSAKPDSARHIEVLRVAEFRRLIRSLYIAAYNHVALIAARTPREIKVLGLETHSGGIFIVIE